MKSSIAGSTSPPTFLFGCVWSFCKYRSWNDAPTSIQQSPSSPTECSDQMFRPSLLDNSLLAASLLAAPPCTHSSSAFLFIFAASHFSCLASFCSLFASVWLDSTKRMAMVSNARSQVALPNLCHNVHMSHVALHSITQWISFWSTP